MKSRAEALPARALVAWFAKVARPMPWRLEPTPYYCWLSEIMMQQTTYEQALPYFKRFVARFPDVPALAAADEQDVLKAWEGLGYYARARNLHKAARAIVANGWPKTREEWLALPGIGPYTASALASVLAGERTCVADGNVARVFSRFWHLEEDFKQGANRERLARRLEAELPKKIVIGDFNQAMMELGALVCTPKTPRCEACPLARGCRAFAAGDAEDFPRKGETKAIPVRTCAYVVVSDGKGRVLLVRNEKGGLLKGLWDLPTVEAANPYAQAFSHFKLEAAVWRAREGARFQDPRKVPLTTSARRILGLDARTP